jgi:hypothetical protein
VDKVKIPTQTKSAQASSAVVGVAKFEKTWVDYGTPYLPLLLTIIGWWVVSNQNDRRERRKEIRELIKQVEQRVDTIISTATAYYALDGKDLKCPELAAKMRYNISALEPLRKRIKIAGLECEIVEEIISFKQAVTGGQFESVGRKKHQGGHENMTETATAGFALIDKFETAYFTKFPVRASWSFKK